MAKKKATKPQKARRAKKSAIKDLEPKANPKGGFALSPQSSISVEDTKLQLPRALKIATYK